MIIPDSLLMKAAKRWYIDTSYAPHGYIALGSTNETNPPEKFMIRKSMLGWLALHYSRSQGYVNDGEVRGKTVEKAVQIARKRWTSEKQK